MAQSNQVINERLVANDIGKTRTGADAYIKPTYANKTVNEAVVRDQVLGNGTGWVPTNDTERNMAAEIGVMPKTGQQMVNENIVGKDITKPGIGYDISYNGAKASNWWDNRTGLEKGAMIGGGAALVGLPIAAYLYKKSKSKKDARKKSFSEEVCENKSFISAANTVDLVSIIDPVNYSERTAALISGLTNTPYSYVATIMNEVADFNANFSDKGTPIFINEIAKIYDNFSEEIYNNYGKYLSSLSNFDEEAAEQKIDDLSELISIIDEKTAKELGTDYVANIISNATDTDVNLLKSTLDKYIYEDEIKEYQDNLEQRLQKVENAIENAQSKTDAAEEAVEDAKDTVQESFSEVFVKKNGQYYKFNDAVVTVRGMYRNFGNEVNNFINTTRAVGGRELTENEIASKHGWTLPSEVLAGKLRQEKSIAVSNGFMTPEQADEYYGKQYLQGAVDRYNSASKAAAAGGYTPLERVQNGWNSLSTAGKIGVGAGTAGLAGLGVYGAYKLLKKDKKAKRR